MNELLHYHHHSTLNNNGGIRKFVEKSPSSKSTTTIPRNKYVAGSKVATISPSTSSTAKKTMQLPQQQQQHHRHHHLQKQECSHSDHDESNIIVLPLHEKCDDCWSSTSDARSVLHFSKSAHTTKGKKRSLKRYGSLRSIFHALSPTSSPFSLSLRKKKVDIFRRKDNSFHSSVCTDTISNDHTATKTILSPYGPDTIVTNESPYVNTSQRMFLPTNIVNDDCGAVGAGDEDELLDASLATRTYDMRGVVAHITTTTATATTSRVKALVHGTSVLELPTEEDVQSLERLAKQDEINGNVQQAITTWSKVVELRVNHNISSSTIDEIMRVRCKLLMLLLKKDTKDALHEGSKILLNIDQNIIVRDYNASNGKKNWLYPPSPKLLRILIDQKSWSLAIIIAKQLPATTPLHTLAALHYEMAIIMIQEKKNINMFDQHLHDCHHLLLLLEREEESNCTDNKDDNGEVETVRLRPSSKKIVHLLNLVAFAYADHGRYEEALECFQSRFKYLLSSADIAYFHYSKAVTICIPQDLLYKSLEEANLGLRVLEKGKENGHSDTDSNVHQSQCVDDALLSMEQHNDTDTETTSLIPQLYTKLLQIKADILCRLGDTEESLMYYEKVVSILEGRDNLKCCRNAADAANVLYTMGCVCVHAKKYEDAMHYFNRELVLTKAVVGVSHLAVSRVLHELAKVAEKGVLDYEKALEYYKEALVVENAVLKRCVIDIQTLPCCSSAENTKGTPAKQKKQQQQQRNDRSGITKSSARMSHTSVVTVPRTRAASLANLTRHQGCCLKHASLMKEAQQQIMETKRCTGRIHFMHGDFASAIKTSF